MFDIGFWELCLVGLVSLLVIGPEKLPKVARIVGFWIGKTQRIAHSVKQEITQELQAEDLRQMMKQQTDSEPFQDILEQGKDAINEMTSSITSLAEEKSKNKDE